MSMPWGIADPYGEKATLSSALRVCAQATGVITGPRNHCRRMLSPGLGNRQIDCVQAAHLTEVQPQSITAVVAVSFSTAIGAPAGLCR